MKFRIIGIIAGSLFSFTAIEILSKLGYFSENSLLDNRHLEFGIGITILFIIVYWVISRTVTKSSYKETSISALYVLLGVLGTIVLMLLIFWWIFSNIQFSL